jgi:hypothetical protein
MFGRENFNWLLKDGRIMLRLGRKVLAEVVPDEVHRGMWRVQTADGLSDMTNLSRTKDGALVRVAAMLNSAQDGRRSA